MSIATIARRFEAQGVVPVDIKHVVQAVNELLFDEYVCVHGVESTPSNVKGVCYQSRPLSQPGSGIRPMTEHRVVYRVDLAESEQRLVVCKELVHVLDAESVRTQTREDVSDLIDKVRKNKVVIPAGSANDLRAFIEKLAEWQAVAILFPFSYWERAFPLFKQGKLSLHDIASTLELPEAYISGALTEEWRHFRETIFI